MPIAEIDRKISCVPLTFLRSCLHRVEEVEKTKAYGALENLSFLHLREGKGT